MEKPLAPPFDDKAIVPVKASRVAKHFLDLNKQLVDPLEAFKAARGHSNTEEHLWDMKKRILAMLIEFDKLTPRRIHSLENATVAADGSGKIKPMVEKLEVLQRQWRFETDESKRPGLKADSEKQVREIGDTIRLRRELIQPRRPRRNDPTPDTPLAVIPPSGLSKHTRFVRALAQSIKIDRANVNENKQFLRLPAINQVADEVLAFVAMLDFSQAVDKVIMRCDPDNLRKSEPKHPVLQSRWLENRQQIVADLHRASKQFNEEIGKIKERPKAEGVRTNKLRVRAGDPGVATTRTYHRCMVAEKKVLEAKSFPDIVDARRELKHFALEFVLGGTNENRKTRHNKLIRRLDKAYLADREKIEKDRKRDLRDREPFMDPLECHSLHTLNRVYEARLAMQADELAKIVGWTNNPDYGPTAGDGNFTLTLADAECADPNDKPPPQLTRDEVHKKPKPARGAHSARALAEAAAQSSLPGF